MEDEIMDNRVTKDPNPEAGKMTIVFPGIEYTSINCRWGYKIPLIATTGAKVELAIELGF